MQKALLAAVLVVVVVVTWKEGGESGDETLHNATLSRRVCVLGTFLGVWSAKEVCNSC